MRLLALGALAKEEMAAALRQRGAVLVWQALAGLCGICIIGIGLISLHRLVSDHYGPYWADAAIAGLFALVAIIALVVASAIEKRARKRRGLATIMMATASIASETLPDKKSALQALVIAALAGGFWFGRKR